MKRIIRLLIISQSMLVFMNCAGVSQAFRGIPILSEEYRQELINKYVGRPAWLRYDKYEKDTSGLIPSLKPKLALEAWSKITIKEILFGKELFNVVNVIDENGKTHYGLMLDIPIYSDRQKAMPDYQDKLYQDYEYAINRILAFHRYEEQLAIYENEYGEEFAEAIINHRVAIGMTKEAVLESWGKPDDINRTITENIVHDQWIYGEFPNAKYVYLTNNKVTSLQE
ncbi:MAG: hypothetical protein ACE5HI_09760 [bacterium]